MADLTEKRAVKLVGVFDAAMKAYALFWRLLLNCAQLFPASIDTNPEMRFSMSV
jgi:hypothetical protein